MPKFGECPFCHEMKDIRGLGRHVKSCEAIHSKVDAVESQ